MELYSAEAETLQKITNGWLSETDQELEATFGVKGAVDVTTFLAVAQRLRAKGYRSLPQEDRMTIMTPEHIRFTLPTMGVIQQYCRDDTIAGKPFIAMIKDRTLPTSNLDIEDYDVRVKTRRELGVSKDDPKVAQLIATWGQQRKAFRIIRRWTFEGDGLLIDMSIVRGTLKNEKGDYRWMRRFRDQDVMAAPALYEIEVELKRIEGDTVETAMKRLVKGVGEVLRGIQKNSILIRKSTKDRVLKAYQGLVGTNKFRGVPPITLELDNFLKDHEEGVANLRDGYNVTDKADGLRVMAYCDSKGDLFLIDMAMNVYRTGLQNLLCRQSLADGEWVTQTKEKKAIQQLLLFDLYIDIDKKDVTKLPFHTGTAEDGRHSLLKKWTTKWNTDPKIILAGITPATKLQVAMKNFLFAKAGDTSIFQSAGRVLDAFPVYNTDGLIFTPNTLPLPEKAGAAFLAQFKWKPAEDNTIDFLISIEKYPEGREERVFTGVKPGTNETVQYKTLRLYVGSSSDVSHTNPREAILEEKELGSGKRGEYKPVLFNPKEFPDTMASICYLEIKTDPYTGQDYVTTERSGEPIEDKSIVEFAYDGSRPSGWRWVPVRVRLDKTERLQKGILGRTLNSEDTAEGVWNSINEPITVSMIRTGNEQPSEEENEELMKLKEGRQLVARRYYERKATAQDLQLVRGLRDFHNKYIKENILYAAGLKGGKKTLVDLAVGKAADLQKWRRANVSFVLGVDMAGDNITGAQDGAYRRYADTVGRAHRGSVPPMVFAIADSSKPIVDGAAGATDQEKNILRSVFGRVQTSSPVPPFIEKNASRLKMGSDCVSVMFALHYFFEAKETFNGFLKNLADILKVGGYFVGCCFDGEKVFDLLRGVQVKNGVDGESLLWSIKKVYTADDMPEDESAFGMGIDVDFISIGTSHREYLVPFKLLQDKLAKIGCELLTAEELKEVGLKESTALFSSTYEKTGGKFAMSPVVKQFSFLNRWFVFRRKREVDYVEEQEVEEAVKKASLERVFAPAPPSAAAATPINAETRQEKTAREALEASTMKVAKELTALPVEQRIAALTSMPPTERANSLQALTGPVREATLAAMPAAVKVATLAAMENTVAAAAAAAAPVTKKKIRIVAPSGAPEAAAEAAPPRTLQVELGTAAPAEAKTRYTLSEVFQFFDGAALEDRLGINDKGAGRWLSPAAPFPLSDSEDASSVYPSLEHYLAAMKYKLASTKPDLAKSLFSRDGRIHQKFLNQRLLETNSNTKPLSEKRDFELLQEERDEVRKALRPATQKTYSAPIDEAAWATVKDKVLLDALTQRWEKDARLRKIVEAARSQGKILLYYTPGASSSNLGAVRKPDGAIEGDNKMGRILMNLAGFPGF
jgi:hypothetical protein